MNVVWWVVRHEWQLLAADRTSVIALVMFAAALAASTALGVARTEGEHETIAAIEARVEAYAAAPGIDVPAGVPAWGPRHPDFVANDRGTFAALPPAPLAALATGHSDVHANHFKVTAVRRDRAMAAAAVEAPLALRAGAFDVLFVITYLMPLLLLAASVDLTSTERERGTLALVLSQPVGIRTYVFAKLIARAGLLLTPPLIVPLAILAAGGAWPPSADVGRLAMWSAVVLAYGLFWCAVALAVNARGATGAANALQLAIVWLVLVVVVPSGVNVWVSMRAPVPSAVALADAARSATRDALLDGSRVLGHFLEDHPTAGATGPDGLQQYALLQAARDDEIDRRLRPVIEQYETSVEARRRLAGWWAAASPAMLAQRALVELAGTSGERHRAFVSQVDAFRLVWRDYFRPLIVAIAPLEDESLARMPRFQFEEPPLGGAAARAIVPAALLTALALGIGAAGVRRYGGLVRDR